MVDGADAGRKQQPFRRVHGDGGIEDGGARHRQSMAQHFLGPAAQVGDAGDGAEFAAGDRGRHADLTHGRRRDVGGEPLVGPDPVNVLDAAHIVGEAKLHRLGAVGDRAAAHGDDEIGVGGARLLGGGNDGLARGVRRHGVEGADATRSKRAPDFVDFAGLAVERAADHEKGAGHAQPLDLRDNGLGGRMAEHHLVHGAEDDTSLVHGDDPPRTVWLSCFAGNLAELGRGGES